MRWPIDGTDGFKEVPHLMAVGIALYLPGFLTPLVILISDDEIEFHAHTKEQQAVSMAVANSLSPNYAMPELTVFPNSCIKIAHEKEFVTQKNDRKDILKTLMEEFLDVII